MSFVEGDGIARHRYTVWLSCAQRPSYPVATVLEGVK